MNKRIILLFLLLLFSVMVYSQTLVRNINGIYKTSDTIHPFINKEYCYGLSIEGMSKILSDDGFIRVTLIDDNNEEWLIYERNNLYSTELDNNFHNASFETFMLDSIVPISVVIKLEQAYLEISKLNINKTILADKVSFHENFNSTFIQKNIQIVNRINDTLSFYKKAWRADTTFLSNKRYHYKKAFFPEGMPNLKGWDYYAYGYYSPLDDDTPQASNNIVKEFDWRTRHSANIPSTYYYNPDGSGWIPKRRYGQVAAECWAFSTTYSVEALVNLYFNKQYNDKLSVQDILSCSGGGSWDGGGFVSTALNYVRNTGIVNGQCFPFQPYQDVPCENKCDQPIEIVKISGSNYIYGEETIKHKLITEGVLVCSVHEWGHAMSMVGFGVVKAGDMILYGNINNNSSSDFVVEEDSPDIGKPYYIFKQSYSSYGYDKTPFCNIIIDEHNMHCFSIKTPISSLLYSNIGVECVDIDGDGYYNWGIGEKPSNCPECPDEIDSDDFSALLGPYNDRFESVILCDNYVYSDIAENIINIKTWATKKYIDHDIIINKDAILTITDSIHLGKNAKIIIKPGGKLVLEKNSLLTSLCNNKWQGIQVWGNDTDHQNSVNGKCLQGVLELRNGATIENAVCAVELWNPGNYTSEGGIVHAEDAVFRNNAKAVHAINYTNFNPINGNEMPYNSYFRNCTFIIDHNYIGEELFYKHVDLDRVNGIKFTGCSFSVDREVPQVTQWTSGIAAYNAGFMVDSYCNSNYLPCPEEDVVRSSFAGFTSGILSSNDGSTVRTFVVRNSEFSNNEKGIYVENAGYATIVGNEFNIGSKSDCSFGIYAECVSGFTIEENTFIGDNLYLSTNYGIAIKNSRAYNDIYLNEFRNLNCGNISIGNNINSTISSSSQSGLTYTCNSNMGNLNDFCVVRDANVNGISRNQGSSASSASNTFTAAHYHFYNDGDNVINYYYSGGRNQQPADSKLYRVAAVGTSYSNSCESHYGGNNDHITRTPEEINSLQNEFEISLSAFNELNNIYTSRIDGGNTQAEVLDINTATASDAMRLRSQLLGHSPYLSQEVLTTAARRDDVFSSSVLFEILSANPDELKKDTLINYLENKDNPMPEYMTELLREIANGTTARTALESQMAKSEREYLLAAGDIVRSNLNSEESDSEQLRIWLANMNDMASDCLIIASYIQEGDFENALTLAEILPYVYDLQGSEHNEHNDYISLIRLYETLDESGRSILELTEEETLMVEEIAENGNGNSQMMAYSILAQNDPTMASRVACPTLPSASNTRRGTTSSKSDVANAMGFSVSVAPNPASSWSEIEYTLPAGYNKAELVITNTLGINVLEMELSDNQGRKTLDIDNVPSGVYTYFVKCGEFVKTGKLIKK